MMHYKSLKKHVVLASIIATSCIYAQPLGIIGGQTAAATLTLPSLIPLAWRRQ